MFPLVRLVPRSNIIHPSSPSSLGMHAVQRHVSVSLGRNQPERNVLLTDPLRPVLEVVLSGDWVG